MRVSGSDWLGSADDVTSVWRGWVLVFVAVPTTTGKIKLWGSRSRVCFLFGLGQHTHAHTHTCTNTLQVEPI